MARGISTRIERAKRQRNATGAVEECIFRREERERAAAGDVGLRRFRLRGVNGDVPVLRRLGIEFKFIAV